MSETITQTKICNKCKVEKELIWFNKNNRRKDGLDNHCKDCTREYMNSLRPRYKEKSKEYYEQNKEYIAKQKKERYQIDKEEIKAQVKKYRENNKDKVLNRNRNYVSKNREKVTTKSKEYNQKLYAEKKEYILDRNKKYKEKNIKKFKAYQAEYQNSDKMKKWHKDYRQTEKYKAIRRNSDHNRRIEKKIGDVTTEQMLHLQQSSTKCYWCNTQLKNKITHVDHYKPISKGGTHTISNLVITCVHCNLSKNAKDPIAFANSLGRLL